MSEGRIVWTASADRDLLRAYTYLEVRSPKAARKLVADVVEAVDGLAEHPERGRVAELETRRRYRVLAVRMLRVYYRVEDVTVVVVRVWDSRRNPEDFFVPEAEG